LLQGQVVLAVLVGVATEATIAMDYRGQMDSVAEAVEEAVMLELVLAAKAETVLSLLGLRHDVRSTNS
jgi:hypothetical protein